MIVRRTGHGDTSGLQRDVRIVVIDDHAVVRRGLVDLLNHEPGLRVCGEGATAEDGLGLARTQQPDVAIVDLSLGAESGLSLVSALAAAHPDVRVLVLSARDELLFAERALRAGARGYIMKAASADDLLLAVRRVAQGHSYVSEAVSERIMASVSGRAPAGEASPLARLSDREREVFRLVGLGRETRHIAEQLSLSVKTVESHYAHIKEKLGVHSGRELMRLAVFWTQGDPL